MSTQTFSSVAINVVGKYSQAGKLIVGTYRTGAQRIINGANTRYVALLNRRPLSMVNPAVKASLLDVQQQFAGLVEGGIASGSNRTERAIERLAGGINGGIRRLAATSERVEAAFNSTAISTVGSLTMPVAQVSLEIANRAVEGTKRLSARITVAPEEAVEVAAPTPTQPEVKKAVRRIKASN